MKPTWESRDGNIQLFNTDCMRFFLDIHDIETGPIATVTDPPYGIGEAKGKNKSRGNLAVAQDYGSEDWDDQTCQEEIEYLARNTDHQIIFGGNYYDLPPTPCFLVWDKMNGSNDFADCELAWTNLKKAVRMIQHRWNGFLCDGNDGKRVHPTQKPIDVMLWAIGHLPDDGATILDPFMGSGTTGIAAHRLGRKFIGVERSERWFKTAVNRIESELERHPLFDHAEPEPDRQGELFGV